MYLQICLIVCLLSIFQYRSKYDSGTETIGPGQHWQSRGNSTHRTHKVTRCTLPPQPALIVVHLVFYRSSHREPTGQCGPIGKRTTAGVSGRNNLQNFHGTIPLSKLSFSQPGLLSVGRAGMDNPTLNTSALGALTILSSHFSRSSHAQIRHL